MLPAGERQEDGAGTLRKSQGEQQKPQGMEGSSGAPRRAGVEEGARGSGSPGNEPWTGEHLALQSKEVKKQSGGIPAPAGLLQGA